jgi:MFS family permease
LSSAAAAGRLAIFKQRDFTLFLCARLCTSLAAQMIIVAVGWQVYHLSGRLLDLGLIGLSQFLPFLCLSLFAGHAADVYQRRLIIGLCMLAFSICALVLLLFTLRASASVVPIFVVLALFGVARAFLLPATQSFLPNIVPIGMLGNAVAINSSTFQVASIAGPSAGGLLYALGGAVCVYAVAVVLLLGALTMMLCVKQRGAAQQRSGAGEGDLLDGLRFTWRKKPVLGAISLDLFAVLFGGAAALLPAFTKDVLHAGPEVFGYLRAAPGLGALVTALWLAVRPITRRVGVYMFGGVAVFGVATVIFGLTNRYWMAMIALALMGSGDMVSVYIRGLLVQLATPDEIRGRVSAVNSIGIGASNELGEFESGTTAAWFGLVPAIVVGGVLTLLVASLWAGVLFPMLWRLQSFEELKDSS